MRSWYEAFIYLFIIFIIIIFFGASALPPQASWHNDDDAGRLGSILVTTGFVDQDVPLPLYLCPPSWARSE